MSRLPAVGVPIDQTQARWLAAQLGIRLGRRGGAPEAIPLCEWIRGLEIEREHATRAPGWRWPTDVVGTSALGVAKIALAHLLESWAYYSPEGLDALEKRLPSTPADPPFMTAPVGQQLSF